MVELTTGLSKDMISFDTFFEHTRTKKNKGEGTGIRGKLSPPNLGGQFAQKLATKVSILKRTQY